MVRNDPTHWRSYNRGKLPELSILMRCRAQSCSNAQDRTTASLGRRRSTRLKSKAPRLSAAARVIERMFDPLETGRYRQCRRRRRERVRYEKDRGADRAVIVVVGVLRWSLWRCLSQMTVARCSNRPVRIADRVVQIQMDMAKGERDLQRWRCRSRSPLAMSI